MKAAGAPAGPVWTSNQVAMVKFGGKRLVRGQAIGSAACTRRQKKCSHWAKWQQANRQA